MTPERLKILEQGKFDFERFFTYEGRSPFEFDLLGNPIKWIQEDVKVSDDLGKVIFTQPNVKRPDFWSTLALKVVASRYFWGDQAKGEREDSIEKIIGRVSRFFERQAILQGYFNADKAKILRDEIAAICLNQLCVFNSPVWFNVGINQYNKEAGGVSTYKWGFSEGKVLRAYKTDDRPQCSACFILSIEDNMDSIMKVQVAEATLFKAGSGTGTNRSTIRSSKEKITGGGRASGPVSFMRGYDAYANIIKSGGKTRRAAKMEILNVSHPDIIEFIESKQKEEKKAWALIEQGYSGGMNGEAYGSVHFQNCNMSVRVPDEFMEAVRKDGEWQTKNVINGNTCETFKAKEIMKKIAEGTWTCGDPGIQCDTIIQKYHTCKNSGRINATNPCFVGKTKVALADGRDVSFEQLVEEHKRGKQNFCYTIKANGHIGTEEIVNPRLTRKNVKVIKVILDSDEEILCTPDHKFMLKSGEYKQAKDLLLSDSLMPLYEKKVETKPINNHKVKKIEDVWEKYDVYDIEVPNTHNFALSSEVFVHNCSEYVFLDDTACNLASINLMKFLTSDGNFNVEKFRRVIRTYIIAMDLIVDGASYPTAEVAERSHIFRTLGLGYANLGALLMSLGLPYDSDEGRAVAAAITAIMCGEAYKTSAELAALVGPFPGFSENKIPVMEVMNMHRENVKKIDVVKMPSHLKQLVNEAWDCWSDAIELGEKYGFRNAQTTVLAPTGCLVGNTLVTTDRGLVKLSSLGNINGQKWQDISFKVMTDEGPREASKFFINGKAQTRKIVTSSGYEIQGTEKHKIKILNPETNLFVWKRLDEVEEGDIIPLSMNNIFSEPREIKLPLKPELHWNADYEFRTPEKMNERLAELIGYFMGDGSLHSKGLRFCVDNKDDDVIERLRELIKGVFNLNVHINQQEGYKEVAVHSVPLTMWWDACGFSKVKLSHEHKGKGYIPFIPNAVLYSNDRKIYSSFLRGLFEADGSIIAGVPSFSTAYREFSQEIKILLLSLGYPTSTKKDKSQWDNSDLYVLRLKNISYNRVFLENIGFISERKLKDVALSRSLQSGKNDHVYLAPETFEEAIPTDSSYRGAVLLSLKRNSAITREMALKLYQDTHNPQILWALQFFYDSVKLNEDGGIQPTYDLSVPDNVTYTANGFISHNTISFLMDCDTTGIEPDIALVKYKVLSGGGMLKIVNRSVPLALRKLGYSENQTNEIVEYIDKNDTVEGAPWIKEEHMPVFDCAFKPAKGKRSIHYKGHIKMMSVAQPFISGAISKTINMPEQSTVDDIFDAYVYAWEQGLKAVAIYRDGSKRSQPLNTQKTEGEIAKRSKVVEVVRMRQKDMPQTRKAITHRFEIAGHKGYLTVGLFDDGKPGEIFVTMSKEGSTIRGLMDAWATSVSLNLQYGIPVDALFNKFRHQKFEPSGIVRNTGGGELDQDKNMIRTSSSIVDYVAQFMLMNFSAAKKIDIEIPDLDKQVVTEGQKFLQEFSNDGILCPLCGGTAKRIGNCEIMCNSCKQTIRSGCGQ